MDIRPQVLSDTDHVWDLLTEAFADGGRVARLAEALLNHSSRIALVAEQDGEIVGHLQLSQSWLDAPSAVVDVLVMSPVGVAPAWQRRGIGTALIQAGMREARHTGTPLVWLEGDPNIYPPFGFTRGGERGFRAPSDRIPAEAFLVATFDTWQPWMVGTLVYPDDFWRHDCVGPPRGSTE
jgi:putative acetyltransferase